MGNLSRVFQKQRKKTHEEIEFLLPFTGCRKMLGKMPDYLTKFDDVM